jgi:sugar O-acyltransferase (sialic acid O-acetyltransferase NeuD family)
VQDIAIIGAGDFGREVALLVKQINKVAPAWNLLGFYDDNIPKGTHVYNLLVLGKVAEVNACTEPLGIALGVADPHAKKAIVEALVNPLLHFPMLVYPKSELGDEANIFGKGCIITSGCAFAVNIAVGDFVLFNAAITVGHDAQIGAYSSFMPSCNISGRAAIGEACYFGTGSTILQNLSVGSNSIVGAGAVVTKNFPANSKLIGVPAINVNHHAERL